jgi:Uma2 family endonuclease
VSGVGDAAPSIGRTPAEWLAWEEEQPERFELLWDEPTLMAGGSDNHDQLTLNLVRALHDAARGKGCSTRSSDIKIELPNGRWAYPDVFVRCGPRSGQERMFDDPSLIVEVLSPTTSSYDLQAKRWAYTEFSSLQHLLFVAQDQVKVEIASRSEDGSWRSVFYTRHDQTIPLPTLDTDLPLAAIYEDVSFAGDEPVAAEAGG